jgi:shikimate kinase
MQPAATEEPSKPPAPCGVAPSESRAAASSDKHAIGADASATIAAMTLHRGNLYLVGLPGAGKSTLGRQLARRLGKRFVDCDHELEARTGVPIPTIFEIEGEAAFREREVQTLGELAVLDNIVLSTGGGVVLRAENRAYLKANGTVLYLHVEPAVLFERVRHARHRPLLQIGDPQVRLNQLYEERDALYREVADHVVDAVRENVLRYVRMLDSDTQHA